MNEEKPVPIEHDRAIGRGSVALVVVTLITGVVNYVYTTGMAALLTPAEFVVFVAAQALLFMIGTAASAGVPWFLARRLADTTDAAPANAAVSFSLVVNTLLAVVASAVALIVVGSLGSSAEAAAAGIAAAAVCIGSTTVGILMGRGRAVALSAFRFGEVAGRAIFGAIAVLVGFGAAGAIGATAVGSLFFLIPLIPALTQYRPSVDGLRRGNRRRAGGAHRGHCGVRGEPAGSSFRRPRASGGTAAASSLAPPRRAPDSRRQRVALAGDRGRPPFACCSRRRSGPPGALTNDYPAVATTCW